MKNRGKIKNGILTIFLISRLINALEYKTYYQSTYLMDTYERIYMNIN